jgi:hypothetical protein
MCTKPNPVPRYGKSHVPLVKGEEDLLAYHPEKGISLVNFVNADQFPQNMALKDASIVLPDKDAPGSMAAISALARAMNKLGMYAGGSQLF